MDIVIYCIKDAATDWLLWGGILFILLACIIRSLRGWKTSTKMAFSAVVPHVIICAGLVTLFSILTGLFESRLCMFICNVLDILDVLYITYVSLWLVIDKELTMQWAVAILPTVLLDSDCISLEFFLARFFKINWCNNLKKS